MHKWGDSNVDWAGIENAATFIHNYCVKWARLGGDFKEKYGTVRFYANFGLSLHSLIYPGYQRSMFSTWLWRADIYYISPVLNKLFGRIFFKWQSTVYRKSYKLAIKKWPHLKNEIINGADHKEFLEGL